MKNKHIRVIWQSCTNIRFLTLGYHVVWNLYKCCSIKITALEENPTIDLFKTRNPRKNQWPEFESWPAPGPCTLMLLKIAMIYFGASSQRKKKKKFGVIDDPEKSSCTYYSCRCFLSSLKETRVLFFSFYFYDTALLVNKVSGVTNCWRKKKRKQSFGEFRMKIRNFGIFSWVLKEISESFLQTALMYEA